ncbi:MAG: efflux RND transporter permease subunit [Halobacteriota archaeon]
MLDFQRAIDWADDHIVHSPEKVILAFLVVTAVFGVGLGNVSTEAGTEQFATGIPAEEALTAINQEFGPAFTEDVGSTQLIQRDSNVLSKTELLRMLRAQHRLEERGDLRVSSTQSAARLVAQEIDPSATTLEAQIVAVEGATPTEIDRAVAALSDNPAFTGTVSNDFNAKSASASATIGVVQHTLPAGLSSGSSAGQGGSSPLTPIQLTAQRIVGTVGGDITVFGSGIISNEFSQVIGDSLLIVTPAAVVFILVFLVIAYRDLVDLLLGTFSLGMAIVWTFGFLGLAGIPFSQMMIAVPPLLLAVGIDFGIHAINRYREDRKAGNDVGTAMRLATDQLLVAFFIVTGTTVIGFLSNFASDLTPIRDFGLVAAIGIVFTFLIFGVFLPAAKVWIDRVRQSSPIPTMSEEPLGAEGSRLGAVLRGGVVIADKAPALFLLVALLASASAGVYATGVDTSFTQEDFLPPEEVPDYLHQLPEPFKPGEYSVVAQLNFLENKFQTTQGGSVTIYLTGQMENDAKLEEIYRAGENPPASFVTTDRRADETSIVTVIQSQADRDPEFNELVQRNDRNGNGVPDDNLDEVYDYLLDSPARGQTLDYLAEDRRSARVVYSVKADATNTEVTEDGRAMADRFRTESVATGSIVVFQAVADLILESAITSLVLALGGTALFLVFIYWALENEPTIGLANLVPIVFAVAFVAGTMRLAGISFNAFTATILALTIGLGIDYSVHVVHRFIDERREHDLTEALNRTVRGTGGALTGSMLTTTFGIGVLVLSVLDILGQFGVLTALSIAYSFFASLVILPSALVVWDRWNGHNPSAPIGTRNEQSSGTVAVDGGEDA